MRCLVAGFLQKVLQLCLSSSKASKSIKLKNKRSDHLVLSWKGANDAKSIQNPVLCHYKAIPNMKLDKLCRSMQPIRQSLWVRYLAPPSSAERHPSPQAPLLPGLTRRLWWSCLDPDDPPLHPCKIGQRSCRKFPNSVINSCLHHSFARDGASSSSFSKCWISRSGGFESGVLTQKKVLKKACWASQRLVAWHQDFPPHPLSLAYEVAVSCPLVAKELVSPWHLHLQRTAGCDEMPTGI